MNKLDAPFFRAFTPRFRGGIADNCKRFRLVGGGYKAMPPEQDGYFRIESARQIAGPLDALIDPFVRFVHVIGATQVLKSIIGDIWVPFVVEHIRQQMLVLFEDDPKADLFCSMRLMDTLKHHPVISGMLAESRKENRHNVQGTWIKTPFSELLVAGLNDGNVSTLSWPYIWISEAWQHASDGLLFKAFKRADRFADSCKILNESQASLAGTDLHRATQAAHIVPLVWRCPECDGEQTWEWQHWSFERPSEFVPRPQRTGSHEPPKPGTYGGMKWPDDANGTRTIEERARGAYWECIWCGHHINDNRDERQQLCETYRQEYRIESNGVMLSPAQVCFVIPFEAAWDNRFAKTVTNYLVAKAAKAHGNDVPMQDWFMAERAVFYDPRLTQQRVHILSRTNTGAIPDEQTRVMGVDCQQGDIAHRTGKFWWVVRAVDKAGNLHQLGRGYANSWDELVASQKSFNVPNDNVAIDGGNYLQEILDMAAGKMELVEREILKWNGKPTGRKGNFKSVWKVLRGNGTKRSFPHGSGNARKFRSFSPASTYQRQISYNGQPMTVDVPVYEWSNLSVKDHLQNLMQGGINLPKFTALSRDQLPPEMQLIEVGERAYDRQMQNEYRTRVKDKNVWLESNPNVHYRDCECECIVLLDMGGYLGLPAAMEE